MTERYPSEPELKYIREFDCVKDDPFKLVKFIGEIWAYADDGGFVLRKNKLTLHTGGWSGNEDIIRALRDNEYFFMLFWMKSERGGHYLFEIKKVK